MNAQASEIYRITLHFGDKNRGCVLRACERHSVGCLQEAQERQFVGEY
jgi:hypothetical protein